MKTNINITGLSCNGCVTTVSAELKKIPGVTQIEVDLESGAATIDSRASIGEESLRAAVELAGYSMADKK